ncbi:hypothetical protein [Mesorhizobium sp.]|uniref:hypothetical protein n=1 Tax=Mesorhizobium sp. TaxID=1871066 RepID=UPI000FE97A91|nr:hypothetical protein [Mesorhizobium sp.]RWO21735.1 MAG: hypothetical protein EOS09_22240 [Mesorhizobium sp.]
MLRVLPDRELTISGFRVPPGMLPALAVPFQILTTTVLTSQSVHSKYTCSEFCARDRRHVQPLGNPESSLGEVECPLCGPSASGAQAQPGRLRFYLAAAWREAKAAQMTAPERRADRIAVEIDRLKYQSFHVNIEPRRRQLETELAALAG